MVLNSKPNSCRKQEKQFSATNRVKTSLLKLYEDIHIPPQKLIDFTYGEILFESIEKCLSYSSFDQDDIFLDLGAGLGKVVLQVMLQTQVKAAIGIELVEELYQQAILAAATLQTLFKSKDCQFVCGNFLTEPWPGPTILLIGSPCFSLTTLAKLAFRIENTKTIHTVFSLRPLLALHRLQLKKMTRLECSWDSALCYIYS